METKENKERGNNFSPQELNKLKDLLEKYSIILNKKTDHASSKQKDEAWNKLTNEFNADNLVYRNKKQLINKFNNMKKFARKELSQQKRERRGTGGGPPPPKPSDTSEWLCNIMGESIVGLPSIYDSDLILGNTENEEYTLPVLPSVEKDTSLIEIPFIDDQLNDNIIISDAVNKSITDTQDNEEKFDATTPRSMLKQPISSPLASGNRKRKLICTPLETRKKIVTMVNEKEEYMKRKGIREQKLLEFAEQEHYKNMQQKDELHELDMEFKRKLNDLLIQKCNLEIKIEEEKLKKLKFENKDLLD